MRLTNEGAQGNLRAFSRPGEGPVTVPPRQGRSHRMRAPRRTIVPAAALAAALFLAACGSNQGDADADFLSQWRTENTADAARGDSTGADVYLPEIPAGQDPFAPESYRLGAIRSLVLLRGHITDLILLAGELDLGNVEWQEGVRSASEALVAEADHFRRLTPPDEYVEMDRLLVGSLDKIVVHASDLEQALEEGDFDRGSAAIAAMQDEANELSANGVFPSEEISPVVTTLP